MRALSDLSRVFINLSIKSLTEIFVISAERLGVNQTNLHDRLDTPHCRLIADSYFMQAPRQDPSVAAAVSKSPQSLVVVIECWSALCPSLQETFCCTRTPSYWCLKVAFPNSQIISKTCEHSISSAGFNPSVTFKILENFRVKCLDVSTRPLYKAFLPLPPEHSQYWRYSCAQPPALGPLLFKADQ